MSTLSHALGPAHVSSSALSQSGRFPVSDDIEMKPTQIVPKDEDNDPLEDARMDDLFGNDDGLEPRDDEDDSKPESSHITGTSSSSRQESEERQRGHLEYREEDRPRDTIQKVKDKNVGIPNLPVPKSSDGDHWVIRMPNFVKVDSKPFHPDTYMGPEHDDEELQHVENLRERSMTIKLKVENTVRWRWAKDEFGQDIRQSNSRVIRWSDGTLSLRLGKELFDINQTIDTSGNSRGIGGSQGSQSQSQEPAASKTKSQGLTYLVAQHKRAQVLQAEAVITGYMSLRPTGMQSETHRMLVRAVGQKHNKIARLRMAPDPVKDPEREVAELSKLVAKKAKKKPADDGSSGRKRRGYSRKRTADVWSDDEEEHEYAGSEEDEDDRELGKPKSRNEDEAKKGRGDYEEDDFLVADESDDGSERGDRTRKRPRGLDEDVEDDPLDQMEAKIREQEHQERKKRHRSDASQKPEKTGDSDGGDEEMDVESEEEEEDIKVRRTGTGARKKRAIDFEEEDE